MSSVQHAALYLKRKVPFRLRMAKLRSGNSRSSEADSGSGRLAYGNTMQYLRRASGSCVPRRRLHAEEHTSLREFAFHEIHSERGIRPLPLQIFDFCISDFTMTICLQRSYLQGIPSFFGKCSFQTVDFVMSRFVTTCGNQVCFYLSLQLTFTSRFANLMTVDCGPHALTTLTGHHQIL